MNLLKVEIRDSNKKAKKIRREGLVPGCIYGPKFEKSLSVQMPQKDAVRLFRKKSKGNMIEIQVDEDKMIALVDDISKNTLNNEIEHITFQVLDADKKVERTAEIELVEKDMVSGIIQQILFEVPYTAVPADFIDVVTIDVSKCQVGDIITVADLDISKEKKVNLLIETDAVVLKVADKAEIS